MKQKSKGLFKKYDFIFVPLIILVVLSVLFQVFYPSNKMLPMAWIDGVDVGGRDRQEVTDELNKKYNDTDVEIYFGSNIRPTYVVKPADLGVVVGNAERVNSTSYKWYLRLVPTSILWAGAIPPSAPPTIKRDSVSIGNFVSLSLGDSCSVKPVNAIPLVDKGTLKVVRMLKGGTCQIADVKEALQDIEYQADATKVRIPMEEFDADVTDDMARSLASSIDTKLQRDILMTTQRGEKFFIPGSEIMSWLEFFVTNEKIVLSINKTKSSKYYSEVIAPKVTTAAGITVVTTNNLTDTIRKNGSEGKVLNVDETNRRLTAFLMDERQTITLALDTIHPNITYFSRFESSSAGLSALIKYYAQTNNGDYGVVLYELGGAGRTASYNPDRKFNVAGAARMMLAFAMLDRHEQGLWLTEEDVFECANEVLKSFVIDCIDPAVLGNFESSVNWLGVRNTSIDGDNIISTAGDLGQFMQKIYDKRLGLEPTNNQLIYNGLRSAVPRNGISSAIGINNLDATGSVGSSRANATIVFTADTSYILVILTKDASWKNIVELSNQIQGLMSR